MFVKKVMVLRVFPHPKMDQFLKVVVDSFPYLFRSMQRGRRLVERALASKLVPVRSVARSSRCEVFIF